MRIENRHTLLNRVNALREVFDRTKLSQAAAQVWWDTLKDMPDESVFDAMDGWEKTHSKTPAPADIWQQANSLRTTRLEEKARAERAVNAGRAIPDGYGPTPEGKAFFRVIKAWLKGPRRPIHHAVLDAYENGENLPAGVVAWARGQA